MDMDDMNMYISWVAAIAIKTRTFNTISGAKKPYTLHTHAHRTRQHCIQF